MTTRVLQPPSVRLFSFIWILVLIAALPAPAQSVVPAPTRQPGAILSQGRGSASAPKPARLASRVLPTPKNARQDPAAPTPPSVPDPSPDVVPPSPDVSNASSTPAAPAQPPTVDPGSHPTLDALLQKLNEISSAIGKLQDSLKQPVPNVPVPSPEASLPVPNSVNATVIPGSATQPPTADPGSDPALPAVLQRLDAITTAISNLQPAGAVSPLNMPVPRAPATYSDDQEGIAAINLVPELAKLQTSWIKPGTRPEEANTEAGLTNKIADWNTEIRSNKTIKETHESQLKANEDAIGESSRKLDENTLALSKAKFNLSWAKTNQNANAMVSWSNNVAKLKTDRASLITDVRQKQTESIMHVREISRLKKEIAERTLDVDLATAMISLIKAAAPIPGPPLQ